MDDIVFFNTFHRLFLFEETINSILEINELRDEITSYLLGWEISSLVAATRIGWTIVDKSRCKDMVRNIFGTESPFKKNVMKDKRICIIGSGLEYIRKRIADPLKYIKKYSDIGVIRIYYFWDCIDDLSKMNVVNWNFLLATGRPRYVSKMFDMDLGSESTYYNDGVLTLLDKTIDMCCLHDAVSSFYTHRVYSTISQSFDIIQNSSNKIYVDSITINENEVFRYKSNLVKSFTTSNASNDKEMITTTLVLRVSEENISVSLGTLPTLLRDGDIITICHMPMYKYWDEE